LYCDINEFGLKSPAGFTHKGDTIYIGTRQEVRAYLDTNKDGRADTSWTFFNQIPQSEHPYEWTSGLTFGPDGWLYLALTTDSWNAAPSLDPNGYRGSIIRISPDGKKSERVATGIRSVPGMQFNEHGDLFFIDNEGGGNPTEELNVLQPGGFYGHNKKKFQSDSIVKPQFDLKAELAPSAIVFNKKENDFGGKGGNLMVSYYGPGERWTRGAVSSVKIEKGSDGKYQYKETPIADLPKISSLAFGKDGSLYLANHGMADYWYNAVYDNQGYFYKLIYNPAITEFASAEARMKPEKTFSKNSVEAGKQLFAERACLGCHQVDGVTELLGPNLKNVARQFSREEIMQEIMEPSARIKASMMAVRVTKKDGQVMLGRVITSDPNEISMMLVGNHVVSIKREEISKTEDVEKSLMYENLLNGMTDDQKNSLLDYLESLSD
jgi:putative heme-binding domain-containing protein